MKDLPEATGGCMQNIAVSMLPMELRQELTQGVFPDYILREAMHDPNIKGDLELEQSCREAVADRLLAKRPGYPRLMILNAISTREKTVRQEVEAKLGQA